MLGYSCAQIILALLIIVSGCGQNLGDDDISTLKIAARLTGSAYGLPHENLGQWRLAVLWKADAEGHGFIPAEDIALNESAPIRHYSLDVLPPPVEVPVFPVGRVLGRTDAIKAAMGSLIVYEDRDGDGRLSLAAVSGSKHVPEAFEDRLLGVNSHLSLWYFEGAPLGIPTSAGFAVMHSNQACFPELVCAQNGRWLTPRSLSFDRGEFEGDALTILLDPELIKTDSCVSQETLPQYGLCQRLREQIEEQIAIECPSYAKATCVGNPKQKSPVAVFSHQHQAVLSQLSQQECCAARLGEAPWLCQPGRLNCPVGYGCCSGQCQRSCQAMSLSTQWVDIAPGTFIMGQSEGDPCQRGGGEALHEVELTHGFSISATEVTQSQFSAVLGYLPDDINWWSYEPASSAASERPVHGVTWHEAARYCNELSALENLHPCYQCKDQHSQTRCAEKPEFQNRALYSCPGYRLPTEAEWEYAYRAGTQTAFYNGTIQACTEPDPKAAALGWHRYNAKPRTLFAVGQKPPNPWGLFDMAGNLTEWVQDWYTLSPLDGRASRLLKDPYNSNDAFKDMTKDKVYRGGSVFSTPEELRASHRKIQSPSQSLKDVGFRCVKTIN